MTTINNPYASPGPSYSRDALVHNRPRRPVRPPTIDGVPTIAGTAQVGETLTITLAPSDGAAPVTDTVQLQADGVDIDGATSLTYEIQAAEEGAVITAVQTSTNRKGEATATSAATDAVIAAE